ncbi:hypothetical protein HQ496_01255 [bacterium]|nr:hypothetical protein [bacterium]
MSISELKKTRVSSPHPVHSFSPAVSAKSSSAKPVVAKPVLAKTIVPPGKKSTQTTPPVQPDDSRLMIVLTVILVVAIGLIGILFSTILGA